jgi:hypothetical protein
MRQNWYLVVNHESVILAVYGSALGEEAASKARELSSVGPVALRLSASSKRPSVGSPAPARTLSIAFAV